jgi:hypothetical protein
VDSSHLVLVYGILHLEQNLDRQFIEHPDFHIVSYVYCYDDGNKNGDCFPNFHGQYHWK